ncbi:phosphoglycerate mutase domain protein, putative [Perkinsus marinus ATCC 50983]|uniref:Phosphoglycerate mutase domain protein, putative n=1 Tax=Perkinsus marinus (strain ATCC 50983 / TXsc) TaxID=423536 RepID=C5LDD6_PERM5|nr:phosphoglycerate mutase domain protein, putative [Perkinsus marinus ATCC 50983]EER05268.1 phosphoglycerate mutase domain protein, putative [Perkinsus marinus ATCC 50983]|eukprot:XP_002773452.1 phosphoglycerate mutase domain protein, putative [Perkinsus marinus ATCC 50983]
MTVYVVFVRHAESANNKRGTNDTRGNEDNLGSANQRTRARSAQGREADPALTERGLRQAEATARYLDGLAEKGVWTVRKLIVSPMLRTLHTARPMMKTRLGEGEVAIDSRFHEEGGLFQGPRSCRGKDEEFVFGLNRREAFEELDSNRGFEDVQWIGPEESEINGWWTGGFEEQAATRARAKCVAEALWDAVGKIEEDRAGEDNSAIVVVSHGLFLDAVYCELLGMSNVGERSSFFMTANCSVSVMMFSESHRKRRCGFVCHGSIAHLPAELRTGHSIGGLKLDQKWVALS